MMTHQDEQIARANQAAIDLMEAEMLDEERGSKRAALEELMASLGIRARVTASGAYRVELPNGMVGRFASRADAVPFIKRQCKSLMNRGRI
jgi:hypothetical protein